MTRTNRWRLLGAGLAGLWLAACQSKPSFVVVADVKELMTAVIEPAADVYWDAVGTVDDSTGSKSYAPTSPEDWATVRNSAVTIAESGNLLMMDARARDRDEWITLSRAMIDAAKQAIAAAAAKDTAAVFTAGAAVYETCTRCHARYAIPQTAPRPK